VPIPEQRNPEVARKAIAGWLSAKLGTDVEVSAPSAPGMTGFSNETLIFDATHDGRTEGMVLRVQPDAYRLFLEAEFEPQFKVMSALDKRTDIPMPPMLWFEPDPATLGAPFYVMRKVEGQIPSDSPPYHLAGWLTDVSPADRETLWWSGLDTMAAIHRVDWRSLGFDFLSHPHRGAPGLEQQLRYYREYYDFARGDETVAVIEESFAWLEANRPADEPLDLCWGDSRIGNMIFKDFRCVAVLDWEMVTLGNPEQDLAWFLYLDRFHCQDYTSPRLPGLPSPEETVARYESRSGRPVKHLHYYTVFAGMRFAVILVRLSVLMTQYGLRQAGGAGAHDGVIAILARDMRAA
jgi:aminoglycoside phosphotransferase (APT) family kinase protein